MKLLGIITIDRSDVLAKSQGQRWKVKVTEVNWNVASICIFSERNSSLNSQMAVKWYTKLKGAYKNYPIVLQGHPSNLKVTRAEK